MQNKNNTYSTDNLYVPPNTAGSYIPPAPQYAGPCPYCGYCPHCGRSNTHPWGTYPYQPYRWNHQEIWCNGGGAGLSRNEFLGMTYNANQ